MRSFQAEAVHTVTKLVRVMENVSVTWGRVVVIVSQEASVFVTVPGGGVIVCTGIYVMV